MRLDFGVILVSVILQTAAAVLALQLITATGKKYSWLLISSALILMSIRRLIPLFSLAGSGQPLNMAAELIGLVLSLFMLLGIRGVGALFAERKLAEEKNQSLLAEKELILREVHHRIKNNMNVVASLLSLQARNSEDNSAGQALEDARNRVHSMALLYDRLYRSEDFLRLPVRDYLSSLIEDIMRDFPESANVHRHISLDDCTLDSTQVHSLGIILNELLTNIMKHAFCGRNGGTVQITFQKIDGILRLTVQDDGIGLPAEAQQSQSATACGFGLQLIQGLAQQLNGSVRMETVQGTRVTLEFPAVQKQTIT